MKAVAAFLLGASDAYTHVDQNPYGKLVMEEAWKQEITYDWENLDHAASFANWKQEFNKQYDDVESEAAAFITFLENWKMINDHNIADDASFTMGMNQFADMSGDDFLMYIHGHTGSCMNHRTVQERVAMTEVVPDVEAPEAIDWTDVDGESYVSAVKNQGHCGSCWAFSTTGAIEARSAIANKQTGADIVTLSEQQLIDCSKSYGNKGCNGGLMDNAFKYVAAEGGLCSEADYPYTGKTGLVCEASECGTKYDAIKSYSDVTADSEESLMKAVAEGPVSIAIEADQSTFQFYKTGVLSASCGVKLDHGVLVVGYGEMDGQKYWKVKNSWGATWGMDGYVLLCRECDANGMKGECGILMQPSYPELQ